MTPNDKPSKSPPPTAAPAWTAPPTKTGKPCRVCKPGKLCRKHRAGDKVRTGHGGPRPILTRALLDRVEAAAPQANGHQVLWEAAGASHTTWFRWLDQGEEDALDGKLTPERDLWDMVKGHRRALARRLTNAAIDVALGRTATMKDPKTGNIIEAYIKDPDGRLAASLASRLDPMALPPERHRVEGVPDGAPIRVAFSNLLAVEPEDEDGKH